MDLFLAVLFGVFSEFSIMLLGCFIFSEMSDIPVLIISNIITLAVGIVFVFLFKEYDYSRIERTRFEDDDYYYYVTAIPKIKLSNEKTVIKDITAGEKRAGSLKLQKMMIWRMMDHDKLYKRSGGY